MISIIIPVFNQLEYTKQCLEYVEKYTDLGSAEIIVIDNGSTDGTENYFRNSRNYKYIRNSKNMGFPKAVNLGIRTAAGKYYIILNNDVLVTKGWLERLIKTAESDERIGMVGPVTNWISGAQIDKDARYDDISKMEEYAQKVWERHGGQYESYHRLRGFCILIKKELINAIGGFDERFRIGNYEDDDFCLRASKEGFTSVIAKGVFVHHFGSVTFKNIDIDYNALLEENRKKFIQKWEFDPELIEIGDMESSRADLQKGESDSNADLQELFEQGNELAYENRIDEAENVYNRILKINPNHTETLHNLACITYQKGFPEKAVEMLKQAVILDTNFAQAYNTLGKILLSTGKKYDALGYFKQAISNNINFDEAYDNYLNTARECGISADGTPADFVFYTVGMPFDGNTIYTKGLGGSETALFYMARELAAMGYNVKVFNKCENPGIYEGVSYGDLTDFYIFNKFNKIKVFIASRSFKPFFSKINAEKKVLWIHDHFESAFLDEYDFDKIDLSDIEFFTLSRWQTDMWAEGLGISKDKFYITRNGFNPEYYYEKNIKRNRNKLIYSSRPERGLEILLDIFPEIKKQVPEAELHVFAYVPFSDDKEMDLLRKKLKQPGVVMRGSVKQKELAREMMEARVLSYPNIWRETSCISAIEAQAAGLPVVSSILAAIPETVIHNETGILLDGDAHSDEYKKEFISEVVSLMKDDEKWERFSNSGRKRAFGIYTWKKIAEEWAEKFRGVLNNDINHKNRLSLCMIVKDEEKNLPVSLDSVKQIVDEMIVIDTGSGDRTVEIAEEMGAKVFHFDWCDDFSAARNFALSKASGEWILYLDADERIDEENGRKILDLLSQEDGYTAVSINHHTPQEKGNLIKNFSLDYCRIFRNNPEIRFEGRIHEQILPSINRLNGKVLKSDIIIDHFGYGVSAEKRKERFERNAALLLKELEEKPDDAFMHFNLAKVYRLMGKNEEAMREFMSVIEQGEDEVKERILAEAYTALSQIYIGRDEYNLSRKYAAKAEELAPYEILPKYITATIDFIEEKYAESLLKLDKIREIAENRSKKAVTGEIDVAQIYEDMGNCAVKTGDLNLAADYYRKSIKIDNGRHTVHFNLGNVLYAAGNIEGAQKEYETVLEINESFEPAREILSSLKKESKI